MDKPTLNTKQITLTGTEANNVQDAISAMAKDIVGHILAAQYQAVVCDAPSESLATVLRLQVLRDIVLRWEEEQAASLANY